MADCCCSKDKKTILLYACSGGANVAEAADLAVREMMFAGDGSMFCLAGIGAGIDGMRQTARDADINLVIDGCPVDCATKVFDKAGIDNYAYLRVTDLGIEKTKGVRCTKEQVAAIVAKAREVLADKLKGCCS
ncbi:MAG: putative zinc-binding protein [Planctomycetaceae bacterium]|nr:putative zinc-binding protein [Planctomycetaceae bacterium]